MCWALIPCQSLFTMANMPGSRFGPGKQLHIIEGATSRADQPKRNHTCFRIASLQEFIIRLTKAGIAYEDLQGTPGAIKLRPDGIQQIYFRDPDGYWIEMNDAGKQ